MGTTANYALRYPASTDHDRLWEHYQNLAEDVDSVLDTSFGVIKRGSRNSDSSATSTEVGVLRVDSIPILAGKLYRIWTSPLFLIGTVTTDVNSVQLRTNTAGVATTASTLLVQVQGINSNTSHPPILPSVNMPYASGSNQTLSVLLSVARMSGGSGTARLGSSVGTIELVIECVGNDPGDTGVDL